MTILDQKMIQITDKRVGGMIKILDQNKIAESNIKSSDGDLVNTHQE
jgi:hypothetical protein